MGGDAEEALHRADEGLLQPGLETGPVRFPDTPARVKIRAGATELCDEASHHPTTDEARIPLLAMAEKQR